MSARNIFFIGSLLLFSAIFFAAWKKRAPEKPISAPVAESIVEVPIAPVAHISAAPALIVPAQALAPIEPDAIVDNFPEVDQIERLFSSDSSVRLPIVETVSFTSRVPWLNGRPAWIADYASHYETSRHFIARCLNHKADYFSQKVTPGARFNVFRKDAKVEFHLLADLSRCRMLFYYVDGSGEKVLLKTYKISVGKSDGDSGSLTPAGKYSLGDKVAIYKPGSMGFFRDQKTEMIRIFGTRWIPFDREIEGCAKKAKGFGLHGAPWIADPATGQLVEDHTKIGKAVTDGSIWLASEDIEEIYAIVLTKPTFIEIVKEYK